MKILRRATHSIVKMRNQGLYRQMFQKLVMENPDKVPMVLFEVQTGSYVDEDDIVL